MTDEWKVFGVSLGIPVRILNKIKLDDPNGGLDNWKIKMFQFWLQYKPDASWKDVVRALKENDYFSLAGKLTQDYLLATDHDSGNDDSEGWSVSLFLINYHLVLNLFYSYSCG